MKRISLFIVINAISLYIVSLLMDSVYIGSLTSLITLTLIFGCLNVFILIQVVKSSSCSVSFFVYLILGLFSFVINGIVLKLAFSIVPGTHISGFFNAILAAILLTIVNTIFYNVFD